MFGSAWYYSLNFPPLTPPAVVFTPAWTILYVMIFISFVLFVTRRSEKSKLWGYILFLGQIVLNFSWTPIFFGTHNISLALLVIVLLDVMVLFNILEFYKISQKFSLAFIYVALYNIKRTFLKGGFSYEG